MASRWIPGNDFTLLENGEAFYPRVFGAIANARTEVVLETFILFEDKVGLQLQAALIAAARRGAQVDITVDGWGSPDLSQRFLATLAEAGVRVHVFDPGPRPFGWRAVRPPGKPPACIGLAVAIETRKSPAGPRVGTWPGSGCVVRRCRRGRWWRRRPTAARWSRRRRPCRRTDVRRGCR